VTTGETPLLKLVKQHESCMKLNTSHHGKNTTDPSNSSFDIAGEENKVLSAGSFKKTLSSEDVLDSLLEPHFGGNSTSNRNKTPTCEKTQTNELISKFANECIMSTNSEDQTNRQSGKTQSEGQFTKFMNEDELAHTMVAQVNRRGALRDTLNRSDTTEEQKSKTQRQNPH